MRISRLQRFREGFAYRFWIALIVDYEIFAIFESKWTMGGRTAMPAVLRDASRLLLSSLVVSALIHRQVNPSD
jgi:hypothetical protein